MVRMLKKGNISRYLMWPLFLGILVIIVTVIVYLINVAAGYVMLIFSIIYIAIAIYLYFSRFRGLKVALQQSVVNQAKQQGIFFANLDVPHAILTLDGLIIWGNESFYSLSKELEVNNNINKAFPDINKTLLENLRDEKVNCLVTCDGKKYKSCLRVMDLSKIDSSAIRLFDFNEKIVAIYLFDETEYYALKQESDNNKVVVGFIYIDNFEEISESMEDSKASMLIAVVDRKLTRYVSYNSGIIKKLEKDKYFFVTNKKDIEDMILDKFSILEQTKEIISDNNIPLTLSIGIGYEGKSIETNHDSARMAMDMALGRGGDQVVVKKGNEILFFGGKSASTISNVRVRARVKATSFRETLDRKDKVLILGHRNGDLDSLGASIGVYIMARHLGKDVHIVVNTLTKVAKEMKDRFEDKNIYDQRMFITGDEALAIASEKDTLITIVDHNNYDISDEPRLTNIGCDVVVFDHHRVSTVSIQDAILSYIDAAASSTCELVTEIMLYFDDRLRLKQLEADTMYAGILLDTMNFSYHTSSKTFDAASYLKRKGADSDRVRKLFRVDYKAESVKNKIISETEFYKYAYAIAVLEDIDGIEKEVVKADIANELINIKGIKASVVITIVDNGKYSISSRAIDELNVQVLMEKLGGGGHRCQAGALVEANSFEEVVSSVKKAIDEMIEEEK